MLYPLNTLGYIEFDVLCDLNSLEEKLKLNSDLPCLSHNIFLVIGRYNDKLEYMVHRVYICSNLKSYTIVPESEHLEDCSCNINAMSSFSSPICNPLSGSQKWECCWMLPCTTTIASPFFV